MKIDIIIGENGCMGCMQKIILYGQDGNRKDRYGPFGPGFWPDLEVKSILGGNRKSMK